MRTTIVLAGALFLLGGVSGCGSDSHEELLKDIIDTTEDAGRVMKRIKTAADAKKYAPELKKLGEKLRQHKERAEALKAPPDREEKEELEKKYRARLDKAVSTVSTQWNRIKKKPALMKVLREQGALVDFGFSD